MLILRQFFLLTLYLLCCLVPRLYAVEPLILDEKFIRDKGELSLVEAGGEYSTDHFWNKHGKKLPTFNDFKQTKISFSAEYGLTPKDTLGAYVFYVQNADRLNGKKRGVGDLELNWKRFLGCCGPYLFAMRILGIFPVGAKKRSVSYGEYGAEIDLHCQRSFSFFDRCGWYELLAGYRFYKGAPSDQIRADAVVGYQLLSRLRIISGLYLEYGIFNGSKKFQGPVILLNNNYRLLKAQVQAVITIKPFLSGAVGYFQHIWGCNVGTGGGYFGAIWVDF